MRNEMIFLWAALVAYVLGGSLAIGGVIVRKRAEKVVLALTLLGIVLHTTSLALRWIRLDHGPFVSLFEILSSNIWGLMLVLAVAYWRIPAIRQVAAVVMPIMFLMMGWLLMLHPGETAMPATFRTTWLFVHVGFAKVFLGALLIAVGTSGVILLRATQRGRRWFENLPDDRRLDDLSFRFMALALVFHILMLIAGAIWAQDAWGRYWAWDPLETWSFLTWVTVALSMHARVAYKISPVNAAWMVIAVFVVAFLTFFGIPFISQAAHKGAV